MSRMDSNAGGEGKAGVDQLRDAAAQAKQGLHDVGNQVRDAASQQYENLRQQAADYYEQGKQRYDEWEQGLEHYVQEKPIQSLLIAAGVGMLLGILWKRS